jgi:hypothetical protein
VFVFAFQLEKPLLLVLGLRAAPPLQQVKLADGLEQLPNLSASVALQHVNSKRQSATSKAGVARTHGTTLATSAGDFRLKG